MAKKTKQIIRNILAWACLAFVLAYIVSGAVKMVKKTKNDSQEYFGRQEIAIADSLMTPEVLLSFGRLSDPQLSPDGTKILYGVSYTSAERNKSCRNLFVCNTDGSGRIQITFSGSSISNARWSADGKRIAFIMSGQVWTAPLKKKKDGLSIGKPVRVSDIPAGISAFTLSPVQDRIMFVSNVKGQVKTPSDIYQDLPDAGAYTAEDLMYRHWDHWVKEIPHTFVARFSFRKAAEGSIVPGTSTDILKPAGESHKPGDEDWEMFELPLEPFSGIEQLCWSPDGKYIAYSCKKMTGRNYAFSTNTEIYIYDVESGETRQITEGGGYDTTPVWSPDGGRICWLSMERDGYEADKQRLMVASLDFSDGIPKASGITDVTAGFKYNANAPIWADDSESIYFSALAEGLQGIFRAEKSSVPSGAAGNWRITRITGENDWYDFDTPFAVVGNEDGTVLLGSRCSMDFPTELVAVRIRPDGGNAEYSPITDENGDILAQLKPEKTEARYIRTVDGKEMLTWVMFPPDFDENRTYPSILICLGGPQGTLSQGWSYRWNYRLMAHQGYVVVMPNRRGTTAFGQEWTEQISGDYSGLNIQDYLSAAKAIKKERYIGKMAACGASYGGYSVYFLCGSHGDTFDAFIAHAGIFNEEHMYYTTEEMWFPNWDNGGLHEYEADPRVGTQDCPVGPAGDGETFGGIRQGGSPWSTNPAAVRHYENSPHKFVKNWHTPLLVIHGGNDFRVPVDEGLAAFNAAQMMGVPSKLIVFPDENHWILKPQNALYWHREYFAWLDRWCK